MSTFRAPRIDRRGRAPAGRRALGGARRRHRSLSGARRPADRAPLLDITAIAELRGIAATAAAGRSARRRPGATSLRAELPPLFDALKAAAREVGGVPDPERRHGRRQPLQRLARRRRHAGAAGARCRGRARSAARRARVAGRATSCSATGAPRAPPTSSSSRCASRARSARGALGFLKLGGRRYLVISMTMVARRPRRRRARRDRRRAASPSAAARPRAQRLPALEARAGRRATRRDLAAAVEPADSRRSRRSTTCAAAPPTASTRRSRCCAAPSRS